MGHAASLSQRPTIGQTQGNATDMPRDFEILDGFFSAMPPARAMAIRTESFDGQALVLRAPLAANLNDKGCAFGGSLVSLMTLAGWGRVVLGLREVGIEAEVYVADSEVRYLAPLYDDLRAEASLATDEDWQQVLHRYRERGRSRVRLQSSISDASGKIVASLNGRYAILRGDG
jgi:thioesterase domain-containing protein